MYKYASEINRRRARRTPAKPCRQVGVGVDLTKDSLPKWPILSRTEREFFSGQRKGQILLLYVQKGKKARTRVSLPIRDTLAPFIFAGIYSW